MSECNDNKFYSAFESKKGWNEDQLTAYSFDVIGLVQKFATAIAAMCYMSGLNNMNYQDGPDRTKNYYYIPELKNRNGQFSRFYVDVYLGGYVPNTRKQPSSEPKGALSSLRILTHFAYREWPMPELRIETAKRLQNLLQRALRDQLAEDQGSSVIIRHKK